MNTQLEEIYSDVDCDLSTEWLELSARVRAAASQIQTKTNGTIFAAEASELAADSEKLCTHYECIHHNVSKLLAEMDEKVTEFDFSSPHLDPAEVQRETIQIHRENHELRANFKDVIKALFMWQDDPVERVREKK